MNHYAAIGFQREPFSNSPDPNFLLGTRQHATCLQELEISLRLRRGLNLVTGEIGTGKTTLCRSLLRAFAQDAGTDVHLLLDPHFDSSEEFLRVILASVTGQSPEPGLGLWALKETLKQQLFRLGMVEKRLVVLIIDEGQKISPANLEILRELLNYETNTSKLLQIVIFAQRELEPIVDAMPNLADRINVRRRLRPLSFGETRQMVRHRLAVAAAGAQPAARFSLPALLAIHLACGGSPRKTVRLCHMALMEMLVRGKKSVGLAEVRGCAQPDATPRRVPRRAAGLAMLTVLSLGLGGLWLSLGASGPVLGTPAGQAQARPAGQEAGPAVAAISPQKLSLSPDEAQAGQATAAQQAQGADATQSPLAGRVSLLPQHDQGPAMREMVEPPHAPQPQAPLPQAEDQPALEPVNSQTAALALAQRPMARQLGASAPERQ